MRGLSWGFCWCFWFGTFLPLQVLFLTLPTRAALQNSVLLVFGHVWRSLPAGLLLAGAWAVMVLVLQPWFSLLLLCAGAPMSDCVVGGFSALACDGKGVFHHAAPAGTAAGRGGTRTLTGQSFP